MIGDWDGGEAPRKTQQLIKGKLPVLDRSLGEAEGRAEPWPMIDHGSARFKEPRLLIGKVKQLSLG